MVGRFRQRTNRGDDRIMVIRHHTRLAQFDTASGQFVGQMVHIGVAGSARQDLVSDNKHGGGWIGHGILGMICPNLTQAAGVSNCAVAGYSKGMEFSRPLIRARLLRRYKRFLADMEVDGETITAHCANPGSMMGMAETGMTCWIEGNDDPKRKLRWSWKLVETGTGTAVVDTAIANRVVAEALRQDAVPGVTAGAFRPEVKMGARSRVDFVLGDDTLLEVKSVTLKRGDWAEFPDSVTARGTKHLTELTVAARAGRPAAMLYLLARDDVA